MEVSVIGSEAARKFVKKLHSQAGEFFFKKLCENESERGGFNDKMPVSEQQYDPAM